MLPNHLVVPCCFRGLMIAVLATTQSIMWCWIYTVKVTVCDRPVVLQPLSVLILAHGVAFMINGYELKFYQKYLHSRTLSNMLAVVIILMKRSLLIPHAVNWVYILTKRTQIIQHIDFFVPCNTTSGKCIFWYCSSAFFVFGFKWFPSISRKTFTVLFGKNDP